MTTQRTTLLWKFLRKPFLVLAWGALILPGLPAWAGAISTFNVDTENWGSLGFANVGGFPNFASLQTTSGVSYSSTGGNSGGYVYKTDPDGIWQYFTAPSSFLGNQAGSIGGVLSFDELILNTFGQPALNPQGPIAAVTNGTLTLVYGGGGTTAPISGTTWNSLVVPLVASSWNVSTPTGAIATTVQFNSVLSNITGLYISSDYWTGSGSNGETVGLDNVNLQSPAQTTTPEPGTTGVCLMALGSLAAFLRRVPKR